MCAKLADKHGNISISALLWFVLIVVTVYFGIKLIPPYFNYYMFKIEVEAEAGMAYLHHDQDVIKHIMEKVKLSELPIEEKDIILERRDSEIEIAVSYKIDINFLYKYNKTLFFDIKAVKPIKAKQ